MPLQLPIKSILIDLFSGFSFRNKVENDVNGDLFVVQMKDLERNYSSIKPGLARVSSMKISSKFFLKQGDVLFMAKGANNYAVEYTLALPMAIAASAFFILRPDKTRVVPAYLAWYINQQPVQQYLKENMAGTYIPNINKGAIEGIRVALPPVETQLKIVAVDALRKQECLLMNQVIEKRGLAVRKALLDSVNN